MVKTIRLKTASGNELEDAILTWAIWNMILRKSLNTFDTLSYFLEEEYNLSTNGWILIVIWKETQPTNKQTEVQIIQKFTSNLS